MANLPLPRIPRGLLARIRWMFLLFTVVVAVIGIVQTPDAATSARGKLVGAAATAALAAWAVVRYRTGARASISDVVPPLLLVVMASAYGSPRWAFAPAYVTLYFRSLYGGRYAVAANAFLYFVAWEAAIVASIGVDELTVVDILTSLVAFGFTAGMMHTLADLVRRHEVAAERERLLTSVGARLLVAHDERSVEQAALDGMLELLEEPDAVVGYWPGDEDRVELAAVTGSSPGDVPGSVDLSLLWPDLVVAYRAGQPFTVDRDATEHLEELFGTSLGLREVAVVPLSSGEAVSGAIVAGSRRTIDQTLLDVLGRFAIEVSLSLDRARLITDLQAANAELHRLDVLKEDFVSNVSHELRTPLTAISGFAQTLATRWEALPEDDRRDFVRRIHRQALRQRRLVEDLLLMSKLVAGETGARPELVDLGTALREVARSLPVGDVTVDARGCSVVADPHHLEQVAANLLTNAVKYGRPPFVVEARRCDETVEIRFRDHGDGVPDAFVPALFER